MSPLHVNAFIMCSGFISARRFEIYSDGGYLVMPDQTKQVSMPAFLPNIMSVSKLSPTYKNWLRNSFVFQLSLSVAKKSAKITSRQWG